MKLWKLVTLVVMLGLTVPGASNAESKKFTPDHKKQARKVVVTRSQVVMEKCPGHEMGLIFYRGRYLHHMLKMGSVAVDFERPHTCKRAIYLANRWEVRAHRARIKLGRWLARQHRIQVLNDRRQLYAKWECIHQHEGAWNSNTGNGYYGGLQMDWGFQSAYGSEFMARWGTADKWPVWAQITAAERAYNSGRGFGPWPNTRLMCGV